MIHKPWPMEHPRMVKIVGLSLVGSFVFLYICLSRENSSLIWCTIVAALVPLGVQLFFTGEFAQRVAPIADLLGDEVRVDWWRFALSTEKNVIVHHIFGFYYFLMMYKYYILNARLLFPPNIEKIRGYLEIGRRTSWHFRVNVSPYDLIYHLYRQWTYSVIGQMKPKPFIIGAEIKRHVPEIRQIPSLRYIDLVNRNNQNLLVALLTDSATVEEIASILRTLDMIEKDLKQ